MASANQAGSHTASVTEPSPNSSNEDISELAITQLQDAAVASSKGPQRELPDRRVTADNFEDAYVQFIFYCNPSLPLSLLTAELRKGFRSVPRADGKTFETYTLFKLVQKLESGEIQTWNSLVIELGVERPDPAKNQSTQKVGQYAVRCKRWLHAYHIDAFFHYCLGKPNEYYSNIPNEPKYDSAHPRDGVLPEDDLVLRALIPDLRPKRGRRKDDDEDNDATPKKRQRKATPSSIEQAQRAGSLPPQMLASMVRDISQSASQPPTSLPQNPNDSYPKSAFPAYNHDQHMAQLWASAQKAFMGPQSTPPPQSQANPTHDWGGLPKAGSPWPYPQSAIETYPPTNPFQVPDGSQSAHPSARRSTGTTQTRGANKVSASWTNGSPPSASKTGRPRGRPPSYRVEQNGPYATFPSQHDSKDVPADGTTSSPLVAAGQNSNNTTHPPYFSSVQKPSKLSLQVPQHEGGNVRLATPPPKVTLNGGDAGKVNGLSNSSTSQMHGERRTSADFFNSIDDEASEIGEGEFKEDDSKINWKRRALVLQRKLEEAQAELKAVKRRVMEAVM